MNEYNPFYFPNCARNVIINVCINVVFPFRWFEGFNWEGLKKGTLTPPIIPNVRAHCSKYLTLIYLLLLDCLCYGFSPRRFSTRSHQQLTQVTSTGSQRTTRTRPLMTTRAGMWISEALLCPSDRKGTCLLLAPGPS